MTGKAFSTEAETRQPFRMIFATCSYTPLNDSSMKTLTFSPTPRMRRRPVPSSPAVTTASPVIFSKVAPRAWSASAKEPMKQ